MKTAAEIKAEWQEFTPERLESMNPAEYREAMLASYRKELEWLIRDKEDVSLYAGMYRLEVEEPHRRQKTIQRVLKQASDLQDPPPDYEYWSKAAYWTVREACQLLCGIEPDRASKYDQTEFTKMAAYSALVSAYYRLLRLMGRELNESDTLIASPRILHDPLAFGWTQVSPSWVMEWVAANQIPAPEALETAMAARPKMAREGLASDDEGLGAKERNNLLRMIVALAKEAGISIEEGQGGAAAIEAAIIAAGFDGPKERAIRTTLKLARDVI